MLLQLSELKKVMRSLGIKPTDSDLIEMCSVVDEDGNDVTPTTAVYIVCSVNGFVDTTCCAACLVCYLFMAVVVLRLTHLC